MIISDKHQFCFIHIPKCAGTTVKRQLQKYDDNNGKFTAYVGPHPNIESLDYTHIPLRGLKLFFPEEYEKIFNYYSIAIVRDPFARFPSSMSQRCRMYGNSLQNMTTRQIITEVDKTINYLSKIDKTDIFPPEYIHFQRQVSYIIDNNTSPINKIYRVDQVEILLRDIEILIGMQLEGEDALEKQHKNKSVVYRSDSINYIYNTLKSVIGRPIKAILPEDIHNRIRSFVYVPRDQRLNKLFSSAYVSEFISEYYKEDIELHSKMAD